MPKYTKYELFHVYKEPKQLPLVGQKLPNHTMEQWKREPATRSKIVPSIEKKKEKEKVIPERFWQLPMDLFSQDEADEVDLFLLEKLFKRELEQEGGGSESSTKIASRPSTPLPPVPEVSCDSLVHVTLPKTRNEYRQKAIARWLEKRKRRVWGKRKFPEYESRRQLAKSRPRVNGRFIREHFWTPVSQVYQTLAK